MKIEVGKKYELNNGEVHECTHMRDDDPMHVDCYGYGPFVIDDILYHQDGRFADADADHEYSVKREVLTVQAGKYYRTRDGRKVGPMEWVGDGGAADWGCPSGQTAPYFDRWVKSGRYYSTGEHPADLIAEWTEPETGTLAELDVKPGDVVEFVQWPDGDNDWNVTYGVKVRTIKEVSGKIRAIDDDGMFFTFNSQSIFRIISRASDTPKTWGEMTDAEKGELLLADHEGKVIEMYAPGMGVWHWKRNAGFIGRDAYRIKPEPVRETVTLYGYVQTNGNGSQFDDCWKASSTNTHRITFTTTDGKPDLDSIKMEALG